MLRCCRAIEYLYDSIDVTKIKEEDFSKTPTRKTFVISLSDDTRTFLNVMNDYVVRKGKSFYSASKESLDKDGLNVDTSINLDTFLAVVRTLKGCGFCQFADIDEDLLDPSIKERLDNIDKTWDYKSGYDCEISNKLKISDTDFEVKTLLALCQYPEGLAQEMYDYYKQPHEFSLKAFKDFKVVDNRIIIPLSEADKYRLRKYFKSRGITEGLNETSAVNAIVISKNLNDYFYCSYGNAFQSCFALNSQYAAWYGYLPFVMAEESYMIYATTGNVNKTSVVSGNKFHSPNMLFRAWAYASETGELLIDKRYKSNNIAAECISFFLDFLANNFGAKLGGRYNLHNNGKGIADIYKKHHLGFYADSLRLESDDECVVYSYSSGNSSVGGQYTAPWKSKHANFLEYAQTVTSISSSLDLSKPTVVAEGALINPKICPVTGIFIEQSKDAHVYAKYFTKPVKSLAILEYSSGCVRAEYVTKDVVDSSSIFIDINRRGNAGYFNGGKLVVGNCQSPFQGGHTITLKPLKEFLKGHIKDTGLDAILLKVIEQDKITCQVIKK